jgi:hypothetical protein
VLPLVLQLQTDALNQDISVSDLLLKAKVVATKLNLETFLQVIEHEINGYTEKNEVPEYRKIRGSVQAYDLYQGWISVLFNNSDMENTISTHTVFHPLSYLENLIGDRDSNGSFSLTFPANAQQVLAQLTDCRTKFQLEISKSSLVGIVYAVREAILDRSLQLEKAGILGDGMQFSTDEKKKAQIAEHHYHIQNVGVLGDVSGQATVTSNQSAQYTAKDLQSLIGVVKEIEKNLGNLPAEPKENLVAHLADLKSELAKTTPESTKIKSILLSIKNIAEGTVGSLIASGILSLITPFIQHVK